MGKSYSRTLICVWTLALLICLGYPTGTIAGAVPDSLPSSFEALLTRYPAVDSLLRRIGQGAALDRADEFINGGTAPFGSYEAGFDPPSGSDDSFWVYSPDHSMAATIMFYEGDVDNALTLFNRGGNGKVENLEFCGTPCQYLGVVWLDNHRLAMAQLREHYYMSGYRVIGFDLVVSVYDLKDTTVTAFLLPPPQSPILLTDLMRQYPVLDSMARNAFLSFTPPAYSKFEKLPIQSIDFRGTPWPPSPDTASDSGWVYSPDRRRAVTIRDYVWDYSGDPRVNLVSYNRLGNRKVELMFSGGPSSSFYDVVWLDDHRFAFFASEAYYDKLRVFAPSYSLEISLFDLASSTRVEWHSPGEKKQDE